MGVQLPATWQSVPAQAQLAGTAATPLTQAVTSSLPPSTGVVAYPMQQYQVNPQVKFIKKKKSILVLKKT